MNPEENFDQLQRLLKLKRYEQPPPRFFNDFSGQVIAQLQAGVRRTPAYQGASWLQRFLGFFEAKPAVVGGLATSVCAMLIGMVVFSEKAGTLPGGFQPVAASSSFTPPIALSAQPDAATLLSSSGNSTNPIIQPGGTLFDRIRLQNALPVSLPVGSP